jgi:hypothetical protein
VLRLGACADADLAVLPQVSDWSIRPLSERQAKYAAQVRAWLEVPGWRCLAGAPACRWHPGASTCCVCV